jgi:hypothetical protein
VSIRLLSVQTGEVVSNVSENLKSTNEQININRPFRTAVTNATAKAMVDISKNTVVLISNIETDNETSKQQVYDTLETELLNIGYRIIDRNEINRIQKEQDMQLSNEFDENTAVQIGNIVGANYFITARVSNGSIRLRVIDVISGEVVKSVSEVIETRTN